MIETGKKFEVTNYTGNGREFTVYTVKKIYTEKQREYIDFKVYTLTRDFNMINPKTGKFLAPNEYLKTAKPDLVKATVKETDHGIGVPGIIIKSGRSTVAKAYELINQIDKLIIIE